MMNISELQQAASNLYDGGWRSTDREELIKEYQLTEDEADAIVELLEQYEEN
ncbi:hypothetical protein [Acidaminococcus intestini]